MAERVGAGLDEQVPADHDDAHREFVGPGAERGTGVDRVGVDLVEVQLVEHHRDQPAAVPGVALDGGQRVVPVGPDLRLLGVDPLDQLPPGPARTGGGERQGVEVHAQHPFGARCFESPVVDDAGVEGVLGGQHRHDLDVRGEQHTAERAAGLLGQQPQTCLDVLDTGLQPDRLGGALGGPGGGQGEGGVLGYDPLPEGLVRRAGE